jgi:curli production assembly/transport component CsgE
LFQTDQSKSNTLLKGLLIAFCSIVIPVFIQLHAADIEVNGLIIDQTRTRIGQNFYREFSTLWGEPQIEMAYNITIQETPDARWGNMITVLVNNHTVYRTTIGTRSSEINKNVATALNQTRFFMRYLLNNNESNDNVDLKGKGY